MAGKDEKDLHANQLRDSELENAAGGEELYITCKVICKICGYETPRPIISIGHEKGKPSTNWQVIQRPPFKHME